MVGRTKMMPRRLWERALDMLFPPSCVGCGEDGMLLCESCRASLPRLHGSCCPHCARPLGATGVCEPCSRYPLHIDGIRAAFRMEGAAREMVHRLKYDGVRVLAPLMGSLMVDQLNADELEADVVVPTPLHPARERRRGYNQALLLAREVARRLGLQLDAKGLGRWKDTPAQVGLEGMETRRANVAGVFRARTTFSGLRVLLVDDVCTTGATLETCAQTLRMAGAIEVRGLVFAR